MKPSAPPQSPPEALFVACARHSVAPTANLLAVNAATQRLARFRTETDIAAAQVGDYSLVRDYLISTSRVGLGQQADSHRTPLGLHRIAEKIGGDAPKGTVFRGRKPVGLVQEGHPEAPIAHRILWLEGMEPGFNRGGHVDTHSRYIYIHGLGDESRLGQPDSIGCVHMAADDLIPLFDELPVGTLVWISEK